MKLSELNIVELISLSNGAEKTIESLAKQIRIAGNLPSERVKNLNSKYIFFQEKYDKILNEINNRLGELEDE